MSLPTLDATGPAMRPAGRASRPQPPAGERPRLARATWPAALVAATMLALWLWWSPPGANDVEPSEGYYGTQARSVLLDHRYPLAPPITPFGDPGYKQPLYPALLALSVRALGPTALALRWPSLLAAALIAIGLSRLVARAAGAAFGVAAAALLMTLPWYADASRIAAAAIPLTLCGVAALLLATDERGGIGRALAAGAMVGLAFQCKMWIAGAVALPALVAIAGRDARARRNIAALALGAFAVGGSHLLAVALFERGELGGWLAFYFRRFLLDRLDSSGMPAAFSQPPLWYAGVLAHALVLIGPLAGAGLEEAWGRRAERVPRMLLAWVSGVVVLSAFAFKIGIYLYPLVPAFAGLAALGAHALAVGRRPVIGPLLVTVLLSPWAMALARVEQPPRGLWLGALTAYGAVVLLAARAPRRRGAAATALLVLPIVGGFARESERLPQRWHDPGIGVVAAAIAPRLAGSAPGAVCYLAADAPAFGYYLFRRGAYWGVEPAPLTAAAIAADTALRVFVVDPADRLTHGLPDAATMAWLTSSTREITSSIEAAAHRRIALRVFVRP